MVNQDKNKKAYTKKMNRQIEEWKDKIEDIESRAKARKAEKNPAVREELMALHKKVRATQDELKSLQDGGEEWPESTRRVSRSYRNLKSSAEDAGQRVKRK